MEEVVRTFPFHKLRFKKYITVEVLMYVEQSQALKFMFAINKESRAFLEYKFNIVRNGFINEGLIPYHFDLSRIDFFNNTLNAYYHFE